MRNRLSLVRESDSFGTIPKIPKTKKNVVILLDPQSIRPRKAQFSHLVPENSRSSHSPFVILLDKFISTFNDRNQYVKFQNLKLSTKNSPCKLFRDLQ